MPTSSASKLLAMLPDPKKKLKLTLTSFFAKRDGKSLFGS